MTYIKITAAHLGDSRWLEAGADAFAVHVWALSYSNEMLRDGKIAKAMAEREALAVPLDRVRPAIDALVAAGFWSVIGDKYLINDYESYALSSDEVRATRDRWKNDQRRRRKHGNGVHDECDPKKCQFRMSHADTSADSIAESSMESRTNTRPDKTRPDQTFRSGSGMEDLAAAAPADAERHSEARTKPHRYVAPIDDPGHCAHCGVARDRHSHLEPVA